MKSSEQLLLESITRHKERVIVTQGHFIMTGTLSASSVDVFYMKYPEDDQFCLNYSMVAFCPENIKKMAYDDDGTSWCIELK